MVYNVVFGGIETRRTRNLMTSTTVVIPPGRYRHYKGNEYEVIGIAQHSETLEPMVVYRPLYGKGGLWVRPAAMFAENVVIDGKTQPRFARI
jgi:hypothetical protein